MTVLLDFILRDYTISCIIPKAKLNVQYVWKITIYFFSSVQSLSCVQLFVTPWTAACQASLSITNSPNLLKVMSIESVMPSNHFILYHPLLLLPSVFLSIRVFSSESVLRIRWPKYWSFSFSIMLPMNIQDWFPLGWTGLISFSPRDSEEFSPTRQFESISSSTLPSWWFSSHICTWLLEKQ